MQMRIYLMIPAGLCLLFLSYLRVRLYYNFDIYWSRGFLPFRPLCREQMNVGNQSTIHEEKSYASHQAANHYVECKSCHFGYIINALREKSTISFGVSIHRSQVQRKKKKVAETPFFVSPKGQYVSSPPLIGRETIYS